MRNILIVFYVVFMVSCELNPIHTGYKYNTGTIPETPTNLIDFNTEFDDYNSTAPWLGGTSPLCFSSNRESSGNNFNVIYKSLDVSMNKDNGKFYIGETKQSEHLDAWANSANLTNALYKINSSADELGPYIIQVRSNASFRPFIFMYATNKNGNFDISYTHNLNQNIFTDGQSITFLNSSSDDLYPTITSDSSEIYFCSNREGKFDIYKSSVNKTGLLILALSDQTTRTITRVDEVSSDYDDKCPFIYDNIMIFASNREGGFGGFDLYYSLHENGKWSVPINFGNQINTIYDEYRPIVIRPLGERFTNEFMLFSSNRQGGKGGFDLYYVGIPYRSNNNVF